MSDEKNSNQVFSAKYFQLSLQHMSDDDIWSLHDTTSKIMTARRSKRNKENKRKYIESLIKKNLKASQKLVDYADFLLQLKEYLNAKNHSCTVTQRRDAVDLVDCVAFVKLPSTVKKKSVVSFYKRVYTTETYFCCVVDHIHVYEYQCNTKYVGVECCRGVYLVSPKKWVKRVTYNEAINF